MSQELLPQDESLVRGLYDKLEWLTFQADDKEFDAEQVSAIVTLLDSMDPDGIYDIEGVGEAVRAKLKSKEKEIIPEEPAQQDDPMDVDAAFSRFKKRYNISEKEMAHKVWDEETDMSKEELSSELIIENDEVKKKLAQLRSQNTAGTAESNADVSESDDSESDPSTRGASASPKAVTAHHAASAESDDSSTVNDGADTPDSNTEHSGNVKSRSKMLAKAAAGVVVAAAAFTALNVGTSAVAEKSFFEIVRDGVNGMRITVTGNQPESTAIDGWDSEADSRTYYDSWEEMEEAVGVDLMQPTYIPEGLELTKISVENAISNKLCRVTYGLEELLITTQVYSGDYFDALFHSNDDWISVASPEDNKNQAEFYEKNGEFQAFIKRDSCLIFIVYKNYDELVKIANSME